MASSASQHRVIPLVVACALFMENLDSTVLATSLPAIAQSLGESPLHLNLAITSYLLSLAVFIPISGWIADRFGARRVFCAAIVIFTLASVSCGFADSFWGFVLSRVVQGMGGAMMVPVGRLVLLRSVPKAELVSALALVTIPALIGPVIGPPLGGILTTYFSWRWIFWINVPIGVLGIAMALIFIRDLPEEDIPPFDWPGFALAALGLAALMLGFETVGRDMLPLAVVVVLLTGGAAALVVYVWHARRAAHPVLDLSLLAIGTFRTAVLGGFLFRIGVGAIPFLLPLMLQLGFGMNALQSGLLTFAAAVGALTMKITAKPILRRFGFRNVLILNALVSAAFIAATGFFEASTPAAVILAVLLLGGFFRSLEFTSINALAYADIPRELMSRATSFASVGQQLSLSVGVGAGALILHTVATLRGNGLAAADDFAPAFFIIAGISALATLIFWRLPPDAGAEVSGRQPVIPTADSLRASDRS
ncbi:MAG: DHA2 family efflux MFS transporter permease subunit [Alphaproteobacteria bacterium]